MFQAWNMAVPTYQTCQSSSCLIIPTYGKDTKHMNECFCTLVKHRYLPAELEVVGGLTPVSDSFEKGSSSDRSHLGNRTNTQSQLEGKTWHVTCVSNSWNQRGNLVSMYQSSSWSPSPLSSSSFSSSSSSTSSSSLACCCPPFPS